MGVVKGGCEVLIVDCIDQWRAAVSRCVNEFAEVSVVGFDVHVVHVEEVFYHCRRLCRAFAFGGAVECHASVGINAAGDEMVEERDVAARGYDVEMFQRKVVALSRPLAAVDAFCVGLTDVDAVVKEPVNLFTGVCVIPRYIRQVFWTCIIHLKAVLAYVLQNQVSVNADI